MSVIFFVDFILIGLGFFLFIEMVVVICYMIFWFIFGVGICFRVIVIVGCIEKENNLDEVMFEK